MKYSINETDNLLKLSLIGAMELQSIRDLQGKIEDMELNKDKDIEVDLSKVDYIDSSGINLLLMLFKQQKQKGKNFKIQNASQNVKDLLQLSSLTDVLS